MNNTRRFEVIEMKLDQISRDLKRILMILNKNSDSFPSPRSPKFASWPELPVIPEKAEPLLFSASPPPMPIPPPRPPTPIPTLPSRRFEVPQPREK